jgi:hypothetical protein
VWRIAPVLLTLLLPAVRSHADSVVWTQAMLAGTIAQYYVEEDRVRVELEIGVADLESFANLLPDRLHERLGRPATPLSERLPLFFDHDLTIVVDDGPPLAGAILAMEGRKRVRRDRVSGEALPTAEDEEPETVLFVELAYALRGRPATLTLHGLRAPRPASIGFVVYHGGVAVNDFRYLGAAQTLQLDWRDPWYTRFESRGLRRRYDAPMSGFLYVEPYEVRKEIVARPLDLQHWVDLGLAGLDTIPVALQPELRRKAAEFLRAHHPVEIDGQRIEPELARVHFLERTLKSSRVVDPPVELDVHSAILGVIFVYPTDGLPQRVTMDWDLWNERLERIPASSVDQAGALPTTLERDWRVLEWRNFLKHPELPTLAVLADPPAALAHGLWTLRWLVLAFAGGVTLWAARRALRDPSERRAPIAIASAALVLSGSGFAWGFTARISDARAHEIVSGLLHNVYRAFDYRDEEQIFDVLDRSVRGALLERLYLETRRGLVLANQGGARAKVKQIELVELTAEPGADGGFVATATWNVAGSVGHWGHVHERRNQYRAELDVAPSDGIWKLVDLEILEEQRL